MAQSQDSPVGHYDRALEHAGVQAYKDRLRGDGYGSLSELGQIERSVLVGYGMDLPAAESAVVRLRAATRAVRSGRGDSAGRIGSGLGRAGSASAGLLVGNNTRDRSVSSFYRSPCQNPAPHPHLPSKCLSCFQPLEEHGGAPEEVPPVTEHRGLPSKVDSSPNVGSVVSKKPAANARNQRHHSSSDVFKVSGCESPRTRFCQCCYMSVRSEIIYCAGCNKTACGRCISKMRCHTCTGRDTCPHRSNASSVAAGEEETGGGGGVKKKIGTFTRQKSFTAASDGNTPGPPKAKSKSKPSPKLSRSRAEDSSKDGVRSPRNFKLRRQKSATPTMGSSIVKGPRDMGASVGATGSPTAVFRFGIGTDLSFNPAGLVPTSHQELAAFCDMRDDPKLSSKVEEKYFHERLRRLLQRGGAELSNGVPYIFARTTTAKVQQRYLEKMKVTFQFSVDYKTSVFVSGQNTLREAMEDACRRLRKMVANRAKTAEEGPLGLGDNVDRVEQLTVRIPGLEVYCAELDIPLFAYSYFRSSVDRKKPVAFQVSPRTEEQTRATPVPVFPLTTATDRDLDFTMKSVKVFNIHSITSPFMFRILSVENFEWDKFFAEAVKKSKRVDYSNTGLFVECSLYHGGVCLGQPHRSAITESGIFMEVADLKLQVSNLPRQVRLCFSVWACVGKKSATRKTDENSDPYGDYIPFGWVNFSLFTFDGRLRTGPQVLRLWMGQSCNPLGTTAQNSDHSSASLQIVIPKANHPIVFMEKEKCREKVDKRAELLMSTSVDTVHGGAEAAIHSMGSDFPLKKVLVADPLYELTPEEKKLTWKFRKYIMENFPSALPKVVLSCQWDKESAVQEMQRLLTVWPPLSALEALQLLDAKFIDPAIREFAVGCISSMSDNELEDYMLQLVQTLKHEPHHASSLCYFLFLRAVRNPRLIGHNLFWYLESELESVEMADRFRLFKKELLLSFNEDFRNELLKQAALVRQLVVIAKQVKDIKERDKRNEVMRESLQKIQEIGCFTLPMDPRIRAGGVIPAECKTMQSATVPLFLTFKNADPLGDKVRVIFKVGDDLRQDILTLQMIRIMENLWKQEGHDLFVLPYRVVATGTNAGMIEVVVNSKTTAEIHKECGGGALGALKEDVLWSYLRKHVENRPAEEQARRVFAMSCAAYCVITYILGIGDRHNDNIMVQSTGNLFHIDFGFILGNFLKFAGIDRETTPFVLTREMVYVMEGQNSETYKKYFLPSCFTGYNILRRHAHLFLSLFSMMLSTGMPNLQKADDLAYFKDAIKLGLSNEEAEKDFERLIKTSLKNTRIYLNNVVHIWAN